MPAKNIIKTYVENGYYHVYNRGVDRRDIFLDNQDCTVFLHYLKLYLSPIEELEKLDITGIRIKKIIDNNLSKEIDLLSFALMPNHLHLQLKQITKDGIIKFTRRLFTSYAMYFNTKYKRRGPLYESTYKATFIDTDLKLLHISRYIHLNPVGVKSAINFTDFSSYPYYLSSKNARWVKPKEILSFFNEKESNASYKSFVEDFVDDSHLIKNLIIEGEDF